MKSKKRTYKSVYFNLDNEQDKIILDFVSQKRSFSTFVKELLYQELELNPSNVNPYDYERTGIERAKEISTNSEDTELIAKKVIELLKQKNIETKSEEIIDVIEKIEEEDSGEDDRRTNMAHNFIKKMGKK